jgi:type I restriction enzyme, S subunit
MPPGLEDIRRVMVPLPPLAEQHRIVAKVNQLMSLCDELAAKQRQQGEARERLSNVLLDKLLAAREPAEFDEHWQRICDHFDLLYGTPDAIGKLRQSILDLAVRGQLVPQDPNDEPASELLKHIEARKESLFAEAKVRKIKACRQVDKDVVPHRVPASWVWTMLGEITDIGTGSTPSRTQPSFWDAGSIPWITSGSTSQTLITAGDEFVTEEAVKAHRLRLYQPGTLLVALYGQGKTRGQVATLGIESTINQACAAVCPLRGFESVHAYLKLLLLKNYDEVRSLSAGGAQPNLNVQKIKEILVPLPPLAEQHRIVAKVDQLMALCDELEAKLKQAQAGSGKLAAAMVQSLLAKD